MSTAFHPQTDGQSERTIQTLEQMLRCAIAVFQEWDWDQLLPYVEMYYNSTASASIEKSPHEFVYETTLKMPIESFLLSDEAAATKLLVPSVEQHLTRLKLVHQAVTDNLEQARLRQKEYADRHGRHVTFEKGE